MSTSLSPYIGFRDNAREAMDFYHSVFGGELQSSTFADFHASEDPAEQDLIMHSQLVTPNGLILMASDTPGSMTFEEGARITVALFGDDDAELGGYWDRLAAGGSVQEPLTTSPWGDRFGMLTDRFGVHWMVNISGASA
ncbi:MULTISPECIES: VOC family protein [unclassified Rathayibacter]|uniref:VOC family protein n=1 Tax=unclassified Rathayibacter TaxID=2609250 RepID=UPI000F4AFCEF|nr:MULTISPECIES: VOC family protein [unclassified Rathayibacter]ROP57439.1 PhnB protein [Rathayibacter sp. PhB186]ROS55824.1 PhnB protein [Rathayibacter sp. PhB185]